MPNDKLTSALLQTIAEMFCQLADDPTLPVPAVGAYEHCARIVKDIDENSDRRINHD